MGNPQALVQRWSSAVYDLSDQTATGPMGQMDTVFKAWVSAVNAHASNSSKQITVLKDYTDSSGASYIGHVFSFESGGQTAYVRDTRRLTTSSNARSIYVIDNWTDDGSLDGYGSMSTSSTPNARINDLHTHEYTGVDADFYLAYDSTEGEEFFCWGQKTGTGINTQGTVCIFKDQHGEWIIWVVFNSDETFVYGYDPDRGTWGGGTGFGIDPTSTAALNVTSSRSGYAANNSSNLTSVTVASPSFIPSSITLRYKIVEGIRPASRHLLAMNTTTNTGAGNFFAVTTNLSTAVMMGYGAVPVVLLGESLPDVS